MNSVGDRVLVKKVIAAIAGIFLLLLLAILVVPHFIDWNRYKDQIAAEAARTSGREVTIGGDIQFSVLPSPALVVEDLSIANIPGGVAPQMAQLGKAEVHVALLPLLSGRVDVKRITLVEPVIALEVVPDHRNNWTFTSDAAGPEPKATAPTEPQPETDLPDVRLDAVEIENGTITYHDVTTGTKQRVEMLNATIKADSLQGPLTSEGSFRLQGIPLEYSIKLGDFATATPIPVTLTLAGPKGDARAVVRGTAENVNTDAKFRGRIEAEADDLADVLRMLTQGPLPGFLSQRAAVAFDLDASAQHASIDALALRLGDTTAEGAVALDFTEELSLAAQLAAGTIDLDSWLAMPDVTPAPAPPPAATTSRADGEDAEPVREGEEAIEGGQPMFRLPPQVTAALTLGVEAITFNNDVIRQVRADGELANGRLILSRLSALLPGSAEAAGVGVLTAADGQPQFEGQLEARAADLRSVLRWLDVDVAMVPAERLRTLQLNSEIAVTPKWMEARDLDVRIDGSTITGTAGVRFAPHPAFAVDLAVDRLNLDGYFPQDLPAPADPAPAEPVTPAQGAPAPGADPLQTLDAEFAIGVTNLTYRGVAARDAVLTGRIADGVLTLINAGLGDFAGATASASGVVRGLPEQPVMDNLAVRFDAPDPDRLLRSFEMNVPAQAQTLGAISGEGTLSGTLLAPAVDLGVQAAGAEIRLAGTLNPEPGVLYSGRVGFATVESSRLLSALAAPYRPQGPLGSTDIGATLAARAEALAISELSGQLAGTPIGGSMTVALTGSRPQITADLTTGRLVLDAWLPADPSTMAPMRMVPAALRPMPRTAGRRAEVIMIAAEGVHGRWSREPIDFSALRDIDASLKLRSEAIVYQGNALDNVDLAAALAGGVLTIEPMRGTLYGGPLTANARVDATGVPAVTLSLNVDGADLGRAPAASQGVAGGRLDANVQLATQGASIADFVSVVNGGGALTVRGLDPAFDTSSLPVLGPMLGPTLSLAGALDSTLGPLLGMAEGPSGPGLADISAPFTINQGIARFDRIRLDSPIYDATARGTANLAAWRIDIAGEMTLAQSAIGTLLSQVQDVPSRCPFSATGPLDRPNIQIGGECLPRGISIPGTGEGGVGRVLEQLIPKEMLPGREQTAPPPDDTPAPAPEQAPQPERVIRDLLEGLIRR